MDVAEVDRSGVEVDLGGVCRDSDSIHPRMRAVAVGPRRSLRFRRRGGGRLQRDIPCAKPSSRSR